MKLSLSLRTQMVLSHLLVSLVGIALLSAFAGQIIFNAARSEAEHNLQSLAVAAGNEIEYAVLQMRDGKLTPSAVRNMLLRMFSDSPEMEFAIFRPDGVMLVDSREVVPSTHASRKSAPEVWDAVHNDISTNVRSDAQGKQILYVSVALKAEAEITGVLRLGSPLQPALASGRQLLGVLLLVAFLIAGGVSSVGYLLANSLARPIQSLTQAAERMAAGDLGVRLPPTGPVETYRMAEAFNNMADRLQAHVDQLRDFVANASHELRTPLTVVKLRTEALRSGALEEPEIAERFLADIENEVDRLVRMVNDLLDLSRMEAGLESGTRRSLDLGAIAAEVKDTFNIRAARTEVTLEVDIEPELPAVTGNEDQLRRVLYNLVENAIKFTPNGGKVEVLVRTDLDRKTVRLLVKDNGPGIPPENLPHIFERFYRAEPGQPRSAQAKGSGLGLAIAKSIVESHGGKIGVNSQPGEGTTMWAELPAS